MEKYKLRVETQAESKEAQDLLFELGYVWLGGEKTPINLNAQYLYTSEDFGLWCGDYHSTFNESGNKLITLPELRDLVVLKRKETMKEYLSEKCELITAPESEAKEPHAKGWLEVPEGSEGYYQYSKGEDDNEFFLKKIGDTYYYANKESCYSWEWYGFELKGHEFVLWQRNAPNVSDDIKTSQVERDYKEISQEYKHYKKDVSNLNSIDVYRVLKLFDVKDPALQHAVKKILCAGDRGTKNKVQDIQEAIASLNRFLEMIKEDDDIPF